MEIDGAAERVIVLIEFGVLDTAQQTLVDTHPQRALGTDMEHTDGTNQYVGAFFVDDGDVEPFVDSLRGWAIGNGLPFRGVLS